MVKPCGASFLELIPLTTHHLPFNHLIGFANGHCLKVVTLSREEGRKCPANLAVHCENEEHRLWFQNAVMDLQVTQHFPEITKQNVTSTASI